MSVFDECEVEAGHNRLAFSVQKQTEALFASTDLIRKSSLAWHARSENTEDIADYLAASSQIAFRVVNDVGAASKLIDCGYFTQAGSLCRSISESGMLALYFAENPSKLRIWRMIPNKERHRNFGQSKLRNEISDNKRFNWLNNYFDLFSEFGGHPAASNVFANFDGNQFHPGPHINNRIYNLLYTDLAILCWHVTDVFGDAANTLFSFDAEKHFPLEVQRYRDSWALIAPTSQND